MDGFYLFLVSHLFLIIFYLITFLYQIDSDDLKVTMKMKLCYFINYRIPFLLILFLRGFYVFFTFGKACIHTIFTEFLICIVFLIIYDLQSSFKPQPEVINCDVMDLPV